MARPQKTATLTEDQIIQMAAVGCTDSEIAALASIDERTLQRSFATLLKTGRADLRTNLRTAQVRKALGHHQQRITDSGAVEVYLTTPDNTMLIWLGKQYLGQRDKSDLDVDVTKLSDDQLSAITKTKGSSGA